MSTARYIVGEALAVLRSLPDQSVQSVITSPPYLAKRSYLPDGHPDKALEIGQEPTPADFLASLLDLTDELWRVVRDDGTIWINLGDTAAFSGGSAFAGSGTTLAVAFGHGRDSIGIDLDQRNAELARQRVGMWLEVENHAAKEGAA